MTQPGIWKDSKNGPLYRVLFTAFVDTPGLREGKIDVVYLDLKYGGLHTRDEEEWHRGFSFVGTMGNEMSDIDATDLYEGLRSFVRGTQK